MLKTSCPADKPLTPPARLAAVGKRLDTMLEAVKTVHSALNDFYGIAKRRAEGAVRGDRPDANEPALGRRKRSSRASERRQAQPKWYISRRRDIAFALRRKGSVR